MIELLLGGITPPNNPLIETVKEPIVIEQVIPELTLEEKIKSNFYQCDESIQWIRADTAECLPKTIVSARTIEKPAKSTINKPQTSSSGWYDYGYCTWYFSTQRSVVQWGDARTWANMARADGWTVSSTPIVGAIAQKGNHVAIVRDISAQSMTIQEANYEGWNVISSRTIPISGWTFIY